MYFKGKRWIEIRYTSKGAYFNHNGIRWYLSEFMRDVAHLNLDYHAYLTLSNTGGMVIKVNDTGEAVKVDYTFYHVVRSDTVRDFWGSDYDDAIEYAKQLNSGAIAFDEFCNIIQDFTALQDYNLYDVFQVGHGLASELLNE